MCRSHGITIVIEAGMVRQAVGPRVKACHPEWALRVLRVKACNQYVDAVSPIQRNTALV